MGKAKTDHTPEQPPLDDDLRWWPIDAARKRRIERTGNNDLAVIDLTELLKQGRLTCMRRSTTTGERKFVAAAEWTDQIKLSCDKDGLLVAHRHPPGDHWKLLYGWVFYIWQPDLDHICSPPVGSAPVDHADDSDAPPRVRPGKKPTGDWPMRIAQWLIEVQADDPKRLQNIDALVIDAQNFLDNQIGWSPSNTSRLRAVIVELVTPVRR